MSKIIFSGLEQLGLNDFANVEIYKKSADTISADLKEDVAIEKNRLTYEKTYTCPVCGNVFKSIAVKSTSYRLAKTDSDFFKRYSLINPYFYDVVLCNKCGYAAMQSDFKKIRASQILLVTNNLSPKWKERVYATPYDVNIAIERYKLSLLNYVVIDSKLSMKAINCLKISWMYRLVNDFDNELMFLNQALEGFNATYYNEDFPIYGMDRFTMMYLIGELNRRVGNNDEALKWLSKVITTQDVKQKLKEMARDQRDLIKEISIKNSSIVETNIESTELKKISLFSKLFRKGASSK